MFVVAPKHVDLFMPLHFKLSYPSLLNAVHVDDTVGLIVRSEAWFEMFVSSV